MNILILFEESGTIRDYAMEQGHNAWSMDLKEGRGKHLDHHVVGDVYRILDSTGSTTLSRQWDLVIMHPDCTCITVAGNRWYAGTQKRRDAIKQIEKLWSYPFQRKCLENPVGVLSTQSALGKVTQYIQPWQFGHTESKKTGLWLCGLSPLVETDNVYEAMIQLPLKDRTKVHYASPGPNRSRDRSKTYDGIARAMIDQWGIL